jgi:DNA replication protein DnaC
MERADKRIAIMKSTFQSSAAALREKLAKSRLYQPIDDDTYKRLQREQFEKLDKTTAQNFKPDLSRVGLHESELGLTWQAISPAISDGVVARDAVKEKYNCGFGMVFLWGSYGQAKTLTGKVLVATAHREGKRAAYANVASVLDDIRLAFDEREAKTTELLRRMEYWTSREVLFLDELDKCNSTEWAQERLFQLLDQRYTRAIREEALTVIASNSSTASLDGYLKSRLADRRLGPVVYLNGTDGRQAMPDEWRF